MWAAEGRNAASLQAFFDGLTDEQKLSIQAASIDMSAGYEKAIRAPEGVPHAEVCFDGCVVEGGVEQGRSWSQRHRACKSRHSSTREPSALIGPLLGRLKIPDFAGNFT